MANWAVFALPRDAASAGDSRDVRRALVVVAAVFGALGIEGSAFGLTPFGLLLAGAVAGLAPAGTIIAAGAAVSALLCLAVLTRPWLREVQ